MSVLLVFLGMQGLSDVEEIPQRPERLSFCSTKVYYPTGRDCNFSKYEITNGVPALYGQTEEIAKERDSLENKRNTLLSQQSILDQSIRDKQRQYDLSLQESIANENRVGLTPEQLRAQIQSFEAQRDQVADNLAKLSTESVEIKSRLDAANTQLEIAVKKAQKNFDRDNAAYSLWVFLIQALLVFPLFFFFLKLYLRLKAKDSPHTIIATTLLAVSGFFVLAVTIRYLWESFLASLIETLAKYFSNLPIFRTLIFYIGMLLVIVIFGGAVYFLQKKVFDPKRVRLRRLRSHKCPFCEFPFDFSKEFCPSCGKQLMEKCQKCNQDRYTVMTHCPHCGTSK